MKAGERHIASRGGPATLVAVSNPGGGIGRHVALTRSAVAIDVLELPESLSLLEKVRRLRTRLQGRPEPLVVTHGVAAGLAARHRGRRLRRVRHVEFWHNDPFFLTPSRRLPFRAIARGGIAPDLQVFVTPWLQPVYGDARTPQARLLPNAVPAAAPVGRTAAGDLRVVYMGRLSPEKGYDDLVAAWPSDSAARGWRLDVFGEGPSGTHDVAGIQRHGHTDDPLSELANSAAVVLPSWTEASPYVALEAMSVATPVIATRTGDLPELLASGCGWLAEPRNVPSLAAALQAAQRSDPVERAAAGSRGRDWLLRHRPFEQWCEAIRELYVP